MEINRKRVARRLASGLVAGALALGGLAISGASPVAATSAVTTETRIAGTDRYETANAVAKATVAASDTAVVIASGENFPDGLAASALAGALGVPMLLTDSGDSIRTTVLGTLTGFAASPGATISDVVLVGGVSAISAGVEAQLTALGYTVTRISGADRYETANSIAAAVKTNNGGVIGTFGGYRTAFLANGNNFPDALAASSWAYKNKHPLFLTDGTSLTAGTKAAMTAAGVQQVIILGGTSAVSAEAATEAAGVSGVITTTRITGDTRYDTATALATTLATVDAGFKTRAMLVSGTNFPDALASAQLAGGSNAYAIIPVTDPLPAAVSTWVTANQATLSTIRAIGGTSAIPADVVTAVKDGATLAPLSATIEALDGETSFKVTFSGNVTQASAQAVASYSLIRATGAAVTLNAGTYTAASAVTGLPASVTVPLASGTLLPGDVVTVRGSSIASLTDATRYVASVSATVAPDATPVTAEITAYAADVSASNLSKIWVTFSDNLKTSSFAAADLEIKTSAIGGTAATITACGLVTGSEYTYYCNLDSTGTDLSIGDTVTLKALSVETTASTPVKNAKVTATVGSDITGPTLTSATYKLSAKDGDQASINVVAASTGSAAATGEVTISARSTGIAAGKAGNLWSIAVDERAGATTVAVSAATKTISIGADDATTAQVVAAALNANADFSANFIANVNATGALAGLVDVSTANDNASIDLVSFAKGGGAAAAGEVTITVKTPGTAGNNWDLTTVAAGAAGSIAVAVNATAKTVAVTANALDTAAAVVAALNADATFAAVLEASVETAGALTGFVTNATAGSPTNGRNVFLAGGTDEATVTATFSEPLFVDGNVGTAATDSGVDHLDITIGGVALTDAVVLPGAQLQQLSGVIIGTLKTAETWVPGVTKVETLAASFAQFKDRAGNAMLAVPAGTSKQGVAVTVAS